jgi:hypothetical protein
MSTISTQLRNFKEPTKDQLTPVPLKDTEKQGTGDIEKMEINAILSLGAQEVEDSYVSSMSPPTYDISCFDST